MKLVCTNRCQWHGQSEEALTAPNPFDPEESIEGCPHCKSVDSLQMACDEPDCWLEVTCGTPTPSGYRQTCHKHAPKPWA